MDNFDLRKYLAENKLIKEDIDFPELEDEFEGAMDAMIVEPEVYLQDIIDASAEEIVSDDYYEIMNAVEQGVYSAEEAVKLAKAWAKDKLSSLAENKLLKEELTWFIDDENSDVRYKNDAYLKEVGDKIKDLYPDISDKDLNKIIIMTGDQYSQQEDFHGDSIPSNHFADAAVEIYQTDILAYR